MEGTRIAGRYLIERQLGRGGMGSVHVALDEKFGERVALKIAAASGAAHEAFRARFAREARIGNRLGRSPGFVRAIDWGELDDGVRLYLAMDLVQDAGPLELTEGGRSERLGTLLTASRLVAEAHRQGVVHRDLKPANFLQSSCGTIHLTDFGLAKAQGEAEDEELASITQTGVGFGTPVYMAPEQFDDAKSVDDRADVYALGVMLFLALTSEMPFATKDFRKLWLEQERVRQGQRSLPRPRDLDPSVPEALDGLCARAMAMESGDRIDAAGFVQGLEEALEGVLPMTPVAPPDPGSAATAPSTPAPAAPPLPEGPPTQAQASAAPPSLDPYAPTAPPPDATPPVEPPSIAVASTVDPSEDALAPLTPVPPTRPRSPDSEPAASAVPRGVPVDPLRLASSAPPDDELAPLTPVSEPGSGSLRWMGCCCGFSFLFFCLSFVLILLDVGGIQGEFDGDLRRPLGEVTAEIHGVMSTGLVEGLDVRDPYVFAYASKTFTTKDHLEVSGRVEDTSLLSLTIDGQSVPVPRNDYRVFFTEEIQLTGYGELMLEVVATDRAGNRDRTTVPITRVRPRDIVTIHSRLDLQKSIPGGRRRFIIKGQLHPIARKNSTLSISGTTMNLDAEKRYSATADLNPRDSTVLMFKVKLSNGEVVEFPYDLQPRGRPPRKGTFGGGKGKGGFGGKGGYGGK